MLCFAHGLWELANNEEPEGADDDQDERRSEDTLED